MVSLRTTLPHQILQWQVTHRSIALCSICLEISREMAHRAYVFLINNDVYRIPFGSPSYLVQAH